MSNEKSALDWACERLDGAKATLAALKTDEHKAEREALAAAALAAEVARNKANIYLAEVTARRLWELKIASPAQAGGENEIGDIYSHYFQGNLYSRFNDEFIAKLEAQIGWSWARRKELLRSNAGYGNIDPMTEAARAIVGRTVRMDAEIQTAKGVYDAAHVVKSQASSKDYCARDDLRRAEFAVTTFATLFEKEVEKTEHRHQGAIKAQESKAAAKAVKAAGVLSVPNEAAARKAARAACEEIIVKNQPASKKRW